MLLVQDHVGRKKSNWAHDSVISTTGVLDFSLLNSSAFPFYELMMLIYHIADLEYEYVFPSLLLMSYFIPYLFGCIHEEENSL